jgi:peptide/nickel transport system substrate-binding protein
VLYKQDTIEAYRNDRFEGFVRQPAVTGPIIYTQSDPSYTLIKPVSGSTANTGGSDTTAASDSDDGGGSSTGLIIGIVVVVIIVIGAGIYFARRRTTADERE